MPLPLFPMPLYFNPRSREGSDESVAELKQIFNISIHAPARGATTYKKGYRPSIKISIHAPARGATGTKIAVLEQWRISIHAPARGATKHTVIQEVIKHISIHAPARGATKEDLLMLLCLRFQSTLPRGERRI